MVWLDFDDYAVHVCSWQRLLLLFLFIFVVVAAANILIFSLLSCRGPSVAGGGRVERGEGGNPAVVDC